MFEREPAIVAELKRIAGTESNALSIVERGVTVSVSYRGQTEARLELRAPYDEHATAARQARAYRDGALDLTAIRPMAIKLRPETSLDGHNKRQGLDVEHQTGDPAFDKGVYIDTPTVPSVLSSIFNDAVREAVTELFAVEFDEIILDDDRGDVVARITQFEDHVEHPISGTRALQAFVTLVKALPKVEHAGGHHPRDPLRTATVGFALLAVGSMFGAAAGCDVDRAAACSGASPAACTFARPAALAAGAVAGVAFGAFLYARLARRYAGTSSSSDRINALSVAVGFLVFSAAAYIVNHLLLLLR